VLPGGRYDRAIDQLVIENRELKMAYRTVSKNGKGYCVERKTSGGRTTTTTRTLHSGLFGKTHGRVISRTVSGPWRR
jgi:hypothetical protein